MATVSHGQTRENTHTQSNWRGKEEIRDTDGLLHIVSKEVCADSGQAHGAPEWAEWTRPGFIISVTRRLTS